MTIGRKQMRLLEITEEFEHPEWCLTGHFGCVVEGSFNLNINGKDSRLGPGDFFVVEANKIEHRHIPGVYPGETVELLLVEDV